MKLLEVFRPRQAGTFAAEPSIDPKNIPGHEACNCADVLLGDKAAEVKSGLDNGGDKRDFHKNILSKWMNLLFNASDRTQAKETLGEIKRSQAVVSPGEDFKRHFIMHMDGAGVSHRDLGFADSDLSSEYISGRNKALSETAAVEPTDFDADHCGTCESYLTSLKNKAKEFKSSMERKTEMLPDAQKPYAEMSTAGLFSRMLDSWTNKNPIKESDHPSVSEGNQIIKRWNDHTQSDHGNPLLSPVSHLRYTPVVEDTDGNEMDNLLDELNSLGGGWEEEQRPDLPPNPMSKGTRKTLEQNYPLENVSENFINNIVTPSEQQHAEDVAKGMELKGEMTRYTLEPQKPAVRVTEEHVGEPELFYDKVDAKFIPMRQVTPREYDMGGTVNPLNVVEMPGLTNFTRGRNRVVERKTVPTQINWNPFRTITDPVTGEERMPTDTWYSQPVQYDTDRPEIVQTWTNHKHDDKCSHGIHDGEDSSQCDGWHADDISDLHSIPRQDAFLFQKAGIKPDIESHKQWLNDKSAFDYQPTHNVIDGKAIAIPEEQKLPEPSREKAIQDYSKSYATALAKAYPGMQIDEARSALATEHESEVNRLMSRTEKVRLSSKKEDDMQTFNSRNSKEAGSVDYTNIDWSTLGGMLWHGVKDFGHAAMTPVNQVRDIINMGHDGTRAVDAMVQLPVEAYGAGLVAEKAIDKYDDAYKLRPEVEEKVNKFKRFLHPRKSEEGREASVNFSERFAAEKKKSPCEKCGKNCQDSVECKQNVEERRRQQAADAI